MKKGILVVVAVLLVGVLLLAGAAVSNYNTLVSLNADVDNKWAQVENQLQRRNDLIPNLVETVKGFAAQEQKVFGDIADARARMAGARSPQEVMDANQELEGALARLLLVVERYPELRSNENFLRLQDELAGTENRIAVERQRYNDGVTGYNVKIRSFPTLLFARLLGFTEKPLFEVAEGAEAVPRVDFQTGGQGG
jgi:LemA protein